MDVSGVFFEAIPAQDGQGHKTQEKSSGAELRANFFHHTLLVSCLGDTLRCKKGSFHGNTLRAFYLAFSFVFFIICRKREKEAPNWSLFLFEKVFELTLCFFFVFSHDTKENMGKPSFCVLWRKK